MARFTVVVDVTVDADSPDDARTQVANMIPESADYSTGEIYDENGDTIEEAD